MSSASSPAPTEADAIAADTAYYRGMLRNLADLGMDLAREHHREATAPEAATAGDGKNCDGKNCDGKNCDGKNGAGDRETASRAFDRAARCVRRTILLAQTVNKPPAKAPDEWSRTMARRYIIRALEDEIHSGVGDETRREALTAELHERLDGPDVAEDLEDRPIEHIVREIKRDLGLAHAPDAAGFKRRTPEDIAVLCARAMERERVVPEPPPPSGQTEGAEAERFFRLLAKP